MPDFIFSSKHRDVWVIGDVHGCAIELNLLLSECHKASKARGKFPIYVILGDLIDRGPDSMQTILNLQNQIGVEIVLLGNHEYSMLMELNGNIDCRSAERQITHEQFRGLERHNQIAVLDFLKSLEMFKFGHDIATGRNFLFSHSPYKHMVEFAKNPCKEMLIQTVNYRSIVANAMSYDTDILNEVENDVTMFHGHCSWDYTPIEAQKIKQSEQRAKCFNLDAGCVYGNELIAMCATTEEVIRIKSGFTFVKK